jgi:hypothetical protein
MSGIGHLVCALQPVGKGLPDRNDHRGHHLRRQRHPQHHSSLRCTRPPCNGSRISSARPPSARSCWSERTPAVGCSPVRRPSPTLRCDLDIAGRTREGVSAVVQISKTATLCHFAQREPASGPRSDARQVRCRRGRARDRRTSRSRFTCRSVAPPLRTSRMLRLASPSARCTCAYPEYAEDRR